MPTGSSISTRTVPISSQELDGAIEVLASAGQALQLSRLERISYRTLMISADVAMASMVSFIVLIVAAVLDQGPGDVWFTLLVAVVLICVLLVSLIVALIALLLSIPVFLVVFREKRRLEERGLGSLAQFLWKESRRTRWLGRVREALIVVIGLVYTLFVGFLVLKVAQEETDELILMTVMVLTLTFMVTVLFSARFLRDQRDRMDLISKADGLRHALQSLRQRSDAGAVSVPVELLERTAKIESTQIAAQRKDAVLQSAAFRPSEYAIAYDGAAAEHRAALGIEDRLELEDLVVQLSTSGVPAGPQGTAGDATGRSTTTSQRVEIEYSVDEAARRIRIVAVTPMSGAGPSLQGAVHA